MGKGVLRKAALVFEAFGSDFTQAPELDLEAKSSGGARAASYQIVRHGLLGDSDTAMPRYQLFRSDVSDENTLKAGFNHIPMFPSRLNNLGNVQLDPIYGEKSDQNGYRSAETIHNPIIQNADTISPTAFSIAANVVDFGIRAYVMKNNRHGTGYLKQIFPTRIPYLTQIMSFWPLRIRHTD